MPGVLGVVSPLAYGLCAGSAAGLLVVALVALRRARPVAARLVPGILALLLAGDVFAYLLGEVRAGRFSWRTSLPLALCNAAVVVAVFALWSRARLAVELTWYVGLAGTIQAVLTPDEQQSFPRLQFFEYLVGHLGVVAAALVLVVGLRVAPRPGSWWRCYLIVLAYTLVVGAVDWVGSANYMFLRRPPASASLLGVLGPWPAYLFAGAGIGLVLVAALGLAFDPAALRRAYDAWAWASVALLGAIVWPLVLVAPKQLRWTTFRYAGFVLAALTGLRPTVVGAAPPGGPFVFVANHESALDGLLVVLAHRSPAAIVVGGPLARQRLAGPFLRALGACFVGPESGRGARATLEELAAPLRRGEDLIGFPEGGLRHPHDGPRLHTGLFRVAVACGAPVVPVALIGSDSILAPGSRRVRHGRIVVHIGAPLLPGGSSAEDARELSVRTRAALGHLGATRFRPVPSTS